MSISARELDQRILIQRAKVTKNRLREEVENWSDKHRAWAKVTETPGREFLKGDQVQASTKAVFKIRWIADVTEKDRVLWGRKIYEVVNVTGTQRERARYLHCETIGEKVK